MNAKLVRLLLIAVLALCMGVRRRVRRRRGGERRASDDAAATAEPAKKIKVGMVTDIGGLNDRSFNQSAYKGLKRAESELGAEIRAITSKSNADYVPNLSTLARQQYDLVDRRRLPDGRGDGEGREARSRRRTSRSSTPRRRR